MQPEFIEQWSSLSSIYYKSLNHHLRTTEVLDDLDVIIHKFGFEVGIINGTQLIVRYKNWVANLDLYFWHEPHLKEEINFPDIEYEFGQNITFHYYMPDEHYEHVRETEKLIASFYFQRDDSDISNSPLICDILERFGYFVDAMEIE